MLHRIVAMVAIALVFTACEEDESSSMDGFDEQEIVDARASKDDFMKTSDESPIPAAQRQHFEGLSYFAPSEEYIVDAVYTPFAKPDTVRLPTTTASDIRTSLRMGTLRFEVGGKRCTLTAFRAVDDKDDGFFVPFKDATTGRETYEVGRYLAVTDVEDSTATIDFNTAYNPYCAYNDSFSCPLVPAENVLAVAIRAGERTWK